MKLKIKNFAKIKDADIIIDGITVIAGENNTGKSTVGKILFSLFNSLSNIDEKVLKERLKEIENANIAILLNNIFGMMKQNKINSGLAMEIPQVIDLELRRELDLERIISDEKLMEIIEKSLKSLWEVTEQENAKEWFKAIEEVYKNTREILNLPEERITLEIVSRYFRRIFYSQIEPLSSDEGDRTELVLSIKGKENKFVFRNNECEEVIENVKILQKAVYIDNPFVLDELSDFEEKEMNLMNKSLVELLVDKSQEGVMDGVIETVRVKEKLNDVYKTLQSVIDGEILLNRSETEYYLKNNDFHKPLSIHNLSTGMKSFMILKLLLEKKNLKNKDVVILDEPEIHLHPQWQITYAELIVLLQKQFDLSIIITTHSPYFVDALNLFSCKYGTDDKVNYYLSASQGNTVTMECVTDEIDLIYKKMASPIQILDTLRHELNNR